MLLVENCMVEVGCKSRVVEKVREVECVVLGPKLNEEGSFIPSSVHTCGQIIMPSSSVLLDSGQRSRQDDMKRMNEAA